ncbi:putative toxin-antitoxin system toxin component, PIN family [Raineya orbicola]|jgi:putative PIN family toxin of toxin-antitoxin system|uniref:Putative toxin-antitoxin system toxin component, PIN family n=1 Tax=Raineya orbicola TaxID=2016530 RepID=A0A2N3IAG2_9BACT|nr:putative toxin-antitoxin system toxin component, PIN family [Raineya orbicola]PKQ67258.1 putative toxin-antitoxin system toxin component, PIN family [Raineya orbicola]
MNDIAKNQIRIIVDTNIWISFLITKNHDKLTELLISGKIVILFSNELLEEFLEVVKRMIYLY